MSFRTSEEIRTSAISLLDNRGSGIRTEAGEPVMDVIDSFSLEAAKQNIVAQYLEAINTIAGWRGIIDDATFKVDLADAFGISAVTLNEDLARRLGAPTDLANDVEALLYVDLNRYATSLGRPRSAGQFATGVLTIFLSNSDPFTLFRGAAVQTGGETGVIYDTTTDLIGVTPSFSVTRNLNFVNVGIRARAVGIDGNQIIGAVNQTANPIPNSVAVTNETAIEGGLNRESNEEVLDALEGVLGGTDINTEQGLINFVSTRQQVVDALVVGPGNTLMTRSTAGAVDVYVIGTELQTNTVDIQVVVEEEGVILPFQPVRQINSAVGASVYTEGGGYLTVETDEEAVFNASSVDGTADLVWQPNPPGPSASEIVTVNFTHNELIRRLQRFFDEDPERGVPGSSIVIKEGLRVGIEVEMKVVPLPGITQIQAESAATDALTTYFTGLRLGELAEYSDALTAVTTAEVEGSLVIDRVDGFVIGETGSALGTDNIERVDNEYNRLDDITFLAP